MLFEAFKKMRDERSFSAAFLVTSGDLALPITWKQFTDDIDIGGPCMVRASAKNYLRVASVTDPLDYGNIANELAAHEGTLGLDTRFRLMKKAFAHTAEYDAAIAKFFTSRTWEEVDATYGQH